MRKSSFRNKINGIAAVAIMVICAWGIAGHLLWSVTRQACYQYVHHVKKERSFRDTLVLHHNIYYNPHKVEKVKKDEIRYAGKMFDIKREILKGDSILLVGHYDDFEHHLYKSLQNLFDDTGTPFPKTVKQSWLAWSAILTPFPDFTPLLFTRVQEHSHRWENNFHYSIDIPPLHAPPDLFV